VAGVRVKDLTKRYGTITAVDHVSFEVRTGEIFALIGPSGAGKSTLLRVVDLLEPPTSGQVCLDSLDLGSLRGPERLTAIKRMGIVFQKPVVFNRPVIDNLRYGLEIRGIPKTEIEREVQLHLKILGLQDIYDRNALRLSGGEAQRVALARTLVCHPEVLLLDEPTANLDPKNVYMIEEGIKEANKKEGTTVIIATHNMFQAKRIAHRVGFMLSGRLVEVGSASEIFNRPKDPRTRYGFLTRRKERVLAPLEPEKRPGGLASGESAELKPVLKLWFETGKGYVFGEGAFELLDRIEKYGTIFAAASSMNMSYRQAWGILKKIEKRLGGPLVEAKRGGAHGGGKAILTPLGQRVLRKYCMEKELLEVTRDDEWGWEDLSRRLSARNKIDAEVVSVEKGDVASIVKVKISAPAVVTAVITRDAVEELDLKEGARVQVVVKATSVMIGKAEE